VISLGNEFVLIFAQQNHQEENENYVLPNIKDSNLEPELVAQGLEYPTTIAFLGSDDMERYYLRCLKLMSQRPGKGAC
jgi:hypothetical protein